MPVAFVPTSPQPVGWQPPGQIAHVVLAAANDTDNDLLPDAFETSHFGSSTLYDRFDDPDGDGANNLEEFLNGTSPTWQDNDADLDGFPN